MAVDFHLDWISFVGVDIDNFANHAVVYGAVFEVIGVIAVDDNFLTNIKTHLTTRAFLLRGEYALKNNIS